MRRSASRVQVISGMVSATESQSLLKSKRRDRILVASSAHECVNISRALAVRDRFARAEKSREKFGQRYTSRAGERRDASPCNTAGNLITRVRLADVRLCMTADVCHFIEFRPCPAPDNILRACVAALLPGK